MPVAEIQTGGNSFRKMPYFFGKSLLFFYGNHLSSAEHTNFCEFCEKDECFQKGGAIFANSAKMTYVAHG